jgi:hypothetical protein
VRLVVVGAAVVERVVTGPLVVAGEPPFRPERTSRTASVTPRRKAAGARYRAAP